MKKARILLALGIWVAILPYLGFPLSWRPFIITITGLGLIALAYILYKEYKNSTQAVDEKTFDNFLENKNFDSEKNNNEN